LPVDDPKDNVSTLVKIDVEGAEVDVIEGGRSWLQPSNLFVIEVHQERFLDLLRDLFAERGLRLVQVDQRPLSLLGREMREEKNWWLVSDIGTLA
ncbi:MAG TPA: FkbM family methyltransferase, partial [Terriglobales bacterium]|nr:FkbM family methyltransferase [Terriglobales bacterium]